MSSDRISNAKKLANESERENMDIETGDFNSNMRVGDTVLPILPPNQLTQEVELKKSLTLTEPLSDSVLSGGPGESTIEHDDARPSGIIDCVFENIEDPRKIELKSDCRMLSEPKIIRCLPWKILLVFSRPEIRSSMGMFLQCNAESTLPHWTCYARATLELISQTKRTSKKFSIRHMFAHKENDWGYQAFINYADLFNLVNGYVVNKTIRVRISVEADAPHGAEWDSKRFTGFVGLKNQGATCYLNSVLQALYCTHRLRQAVFQMPTESDDSQTSVPLALQRVFYELQCSNCSVSTEKLTRSFGWATWDSFMQHDAQELCRVLLDNIEMKMKGTTVEDIIPRLFSGKMVSYIKCKHVNYESKREENFYDIQLKVKGNRDVYEAFKEYVEVETLDQDNKYDAEKFGLQEAEKGVKFIKFPPVLYLQLMRFQYDFHTNNNVKINDRFEFPYELDLSNYLLNAQEAPHTKYFLHAVLVHSGDHHGGHYVVHINPTGNNTWFQFDDDVVSRCSPKDAIEMNYGASDEPDGRPYTNAYMLVYIAVDSKEDVLCSISEENIPESLFSRFYEEQSVDERKRKEKDSAHEFSTINLLLEEDFNGFEGPELFRLDQLPMRSVRVRRDADGKKLLEAVSGILKWLPDEIKLWQVNQREKGSSLVNFKQLNMTELGRDSTLIFWAQHIKSHVSPIIDSVAASRLYFFKFFDTVSFTLTYCGHLELIANIPPTVHFAILRERAGIPNDQQLIFYHETNRGINRTVVEIDFDSLLVCISKPKDAAQGEVIFFQVDTRSSQLVAEETGREAVHFWGSSPVDAHMMSEASPQPNNNHQQPTTECSAPVSSSTLRKMAYKAGDTNHKTVEITFVDYFSSYINQVEILLVDKLRKSDPGLLVRVCPTLTYQEFANLVASYLSARSDHLQFFSSQTSSIGNHHQHHHHSHHNQVAGAGVQGGNDTPLLSGVNLIGSGGSPVSTEGNTISGNGTYSPNSVSGLISVQSLAARASGFADASAQFIGTLASIAQQGLLREPPGPPILSTVQSTLSEFFSIPTPAYPTSATLLSNSASTNTVTTASQDTSSISLARYSGLSNITNSPFGNLNFPAARRVYYAHIALPITQLESLKQIQITFYGPRPSGHLLLSLSVPRNGKVMDLLTEALPHVTLTGSERLRLMEIRSYRIIKIYPEDYPLDQIDDLLNLPILDAHDNLKSGFRIEEIPVDEMTDNNNDVTICAAHFNKDLSDTFGVPFTIRIKQDELYSAVKERIRKRLDVPDKEFDSWNFLIVMKSKSIALPSTEDVNVDTSIFNASQNATQMQQPWLGVEHKPYKRPRYAHSEKPIKIHN